MNEKFEHNGVSELITKQWTELKNVHTRIRVLKSHPLQLYVSKSGDGNRVFIFSLEKINQEIKIPKFESLITTIDTDDSEIVFELLNADFSDTFDSFLFDLVVHSARYDQKQASDIVLNRLARWTKMFKAGGSSGLSEEELLGLLGELITIQQLIATGKNIPYIIESWRGPHGDATDVGTEDFRVEVKTKRSTQHNFVDISSADQLRTDEDPLYLNRILLKPSETGGISVAGMVSEIKTTIESSGNDSSILKSKLAMIGFVWEQIENNNLFEIVRIDCYEVTDMFPRINATDLQQEISNVRYRIDLTNLDKYLVNLEDVLSGEKNDN